MTNKAPAITLPGFFFVWLVGVMRGFVLVTMGAGLLACLTVLDMHPAGVGLLGLLCFAVWQVFFSSDPLARTLHGNDRAAAKAWLERVRRVNVADGTNNTGTKPHDGTSTEARARPTAKAPD